MATAPTLEILRAAAGDAPRDPTVRTQVALVRALVDEIERRSGLDARGSALFSQLDEETARLKRMLAEPVSEPPASLVRLRRSAATGSRD